MIENHQRNTMARRGRPKSNRLPIDRGTDELRAKRALLCREGDPALAEYPLGTLLARGVITPDQHKAGQQYVWLYARFTGRYRDCGLEPEGLGELSDDAAARIEAQYRACRQEMARYGARVGHAVDDVAVYRRLPRWFYSGVRRGTERRDRDALMIGLDLLARLLLGAKS